MPKSSSEEVFTLIHSLNKHEKAYFKIYASKRFYKKNIIYIKLFDIIERQKEFREEKIIRKLNLTGRQRLAGLKNYLFNMILNAMESAHAGKGTVPALNRLLFQVSLLYKKGVYGQCRKILSKARQLACSHEKHLVLLEILDWEKTLIHSDLTKKKMKKQVEDVLEEEKKVFSVLQDARRSSEAKHMVLSHYEKHKVARNRKEKIAYSKIAARAGIKKHQATLSLNSKFDMYYANGLFHYASGNFPQSLKYYKMQVDLIENNPGKLHERNASYFIVLSNYYHACFMQKKYTECLSVIKKIRNVPADSEKMKLQAFRTSYMRELELYINTGEYRKGIHLISEISHGLNIFGEKISGSYRVNFYFDIAHIYFGSEDYSKCLSWLNRILNNTATKETNGDLYGFSMIMAAITLFEMGERNLIHLVKSTHRFLYKKKILYKIVEDLLDFIRVKVPKIKGGNEQIKAFSDLKKKLLLVTKDPYEKRALEYFDIISWLESKTENKSFAEIIKTKSGWNLGQS